MQDAGVTTDEDISDQEQTPFESRPMIAFMNSLLGSLNRNQLSDMNGLFREYLADDCVLRTQLMQSSESPFVNRTVPRERIAEYLTCINESLPDAVWSSSEWKVLREQNALGFNFTLSATLVKYIFDNRIHNRFAPSSAPRQNPPSELDDMRHIDAVGTFVLHLDTNSKVRFFDINIEIEFNDADSSMEL